MPRSYLISLNKYCFPNFSDQGRTFITQTSLAVSVVQETVITCRMLTLIEHIYYMQTLQESGEKPV